jgi:lysine 2,3-aminomutase
VVDAPGGGGKIPLLPDYYIGKTGNEIHLRNYEGKEFIYTEN